jgi:hypothetical protein
VSVTPNKAREAFGELMKRVALEDGLPVVLDELANEARIEAIAFRSALSQRANAKGKAMQNAAAYLTIAADALRLSAEISKGGL